MLENASAAVCTIMAAAKIDSATTTFASLTTGIPSKGGSTIKRASDGMAYNTPTAEITTEPQRGARAAHQPIGTAATKPTTIGIKDNLAWSRVNARIRSLFPSTHSIANSPP